MENPVSPPQVRAPPPSSASAPQKSSVAASLPIIISLSAKSEQITSPLLMAEFHKLIAMQPLSPFFTILWQQFRLLSSLRKSLIRMSSLIHVTKSLFSWESRFPRKIPGRREIDVNYFSLIFCCAFSDRRSSGKPLGESLCLPRNSGTPLLPQLSSWFSRVPQFDVSGIWALLHWSEGVIVIICNCFHADLLPLIFLELSLALILDFSLLLHLPILWPWLRCDSLWMRDRIGLQNLHNPSDWGSDSPLFLATLVLELIASRVWTCLYFSDFCNRINRSASFWLRWLSGVWIIPRALF